MPMTMALPLAKSFPLHAAWDASNRAFRPSAPSFCAMLAAAFLSPLPQPPANVSAAETTIADHVFIMGGIVELDRRGVVLLVLELGVDDVRLLGRLTRRRLAAAGGCLGPAGLLVHGLGKLVRRRLQLLEGTTQLIGVTAVAVALEDLFGLLQCLLDHQ